MSEVQSVLFLKKTWTVTRARAWLKQNKFVFRGKLDARGKYYRFRQKPPGKFKKFRTISTRKGIKKRNNILFVIGF